MNTLFNNSSNFKDLWSHIEKSRKIHLILVIILMIFASMAEVISIGSIIPFLTVILNPDSLYEIELLRNLLKYLNINSAQELIIPFTFLFAVAALISGLIRIFLLWYQIRIGHLIGADLSLKIYKVALYQPYKTHISVNSSQSISTITEKSNAIVRQVILPFLFLISSTLIFLSIFTALFIFNSKVAIFLFLFFGIIYFIIYTFTKNKLVNNSKILSSLLSKRIKILQEGFNGIRDVILNGSQIAYTNTFKKVDLPLRRAQAINSFISSSPRFVIEALGMILISIMIYFIFMRDNNFNNMIPILGAFALGAQRMLPLIQQIYSNITAIKGTESILNDSLKILNQKFPDFYFNNQEILPFKNEIKFQDVSFGYENSNSLVFKKINFQIIKGSKIGIIGTTGSGKSTFVDLLMGLLSPNEGSISIDGHIINEKNVNSWMQNISHVPQFIFLSDSSLLSNIAFGQSEEDIDIERVKIVSKLANISHAIDELPNGYQTVVGEKGIQLSGGQLQRIAIARSLYNNRRILILDEATSSLDEETEASIMKTIYGLDNNITVIIISHRKSSLEGCDFIYELNKGKFTKVYAK